MRYSRQLAQLLRTGELGASLVRSRSTGALGFLHLAKISARRGNMYIILGSIMPLESLCAHTCHHCRRCQVQLHGSGDTDRRTDRRRRDCQVRERRRSLVRQRRLR